MAVNAKIALTRTTFTAIQAGAATVSVSLPKVPGRVGRGDVVELIKATSQPAATTNPEELNDLGIYLENRPDSDAALLNMELEAGETLYGRWISITGRTNEVAADRYVVKF